jgi:hypothetical protein
MSPRNRVRQLRASGDIVVAVLRQGHLEFHSRLRRVHNEEDFMPNAPVDVFCTEAWSQLA